MVVHQNISRALKHRNASSAGFYFIELYRLASPFLSLLPDVSVTFVAKLHFHFLIYMLISSVYCSPVFCRHIACHMTWVCHDCNSATENCFVILSPLCLWNSSSGLFLWKPNLCLSLTNCYMIDFMKFNEHLLPSMRAVFLSKCDCAHMLDPFYIVKQFNVILLMWLVPRMTLLKLPSTLLFAFIIFSPRGCAVNMHRGQSSCRCCLASSKVFQIFFLMQPSG